MSADATRPTPELSVSVVVATRNRAERLRGLLAALARQTLSTDHFELVVVDDGSDDGTRELLARAGTQTSFRITVEEGACRGPAVARNTGWRRAQAALIAFTDDDCEPDPAWLATGVAAADANPGALVQGRTRPIEREAGELGLRSRTKSIDGPGPWYQTCNIFYPRELLARLDGFDERFTRPFGEDVDLAWRAFELGATARFEPKALVHHAVEKLTRRQYVRSGLRDPDEALVFKRHPALRREIGRFRFFKSDRHALLILALAASICARGSHLAAAGAIPYALHVAARARASGATPAEVPLMASHDVLELVAAVRGAVRHRVSFI